MTNEELQEQLLKTQEEVKALKLAKEETLKKNETLVKSNEELVKYNNKLFARVTTKVEEPEETKPVDETEEYIKGVQEILHPQGE